MPTNPTQGDFVVERMPDSDFIVRCEGITRIHLHRFASYEAAIDFALESADHHAAHAFFKGSDGWVCLG